MHYPGGKGKTFHHVVNLMPPHRVYIETHLGGGAVMRHKRAAAHSIGIDADEQVISAWSQRDNHRIELRCERAEDFLSQYQFQGDELIYADPPYHPATRRRARVYRHDYAIDDHARLLTLLISLPCKVILSGYTNDLYSERLQGWRTRTFSAKTHTGLRVETLWFNFEPPQILHDSRFAGETFRARQTTKRRLKRLQEKVIHMDPVERAAFTQWLSEAYPLSTEYNRSNTA